jgi:hypothetical protein
MNRHKLNETSQLQKYLIDRDETMGGGRTPLVRER